MKYLGLKGEAAMVLAFGSLSLYSGIGAMMTMALTAKEITILACMLTVSHSLIIETAIVAKAGANGLLVTGTRLMASVLSAVILNLVL